ncbi:caspase family protein [uncultured Alsobacter sp.]|uniref:caspase family protein n=1 Tax=uncultured Alsobacter sp. TaxID=1748258 RepID=UPI0025F90820|nr:caspase family protein [uncultured Alsobacter sp.]
MPIVRIVLLLLVTLLAVASPAHAERKVALLIGNGAYKSVPALRNPGNDVALMAKTLREAGFDVVDTALDQDERSLRQTLRRFEDKAADADVGVVFYSGHGIEMNGQNYLIPVDARLSADGDVKDEAVPLDRVLEAIDRVKRLKLVILDACRDNPFLASMQRSVGQRSVGRGLARAEPASTGTLIAYAAKAGTVALDGTGANSPFTTALARHVAKPGLDIRLALGTVRDEVLSATGQRQEPFVYGSLGGSTLTLGPAEAAKPAAPAIAGLAPPVAVAPAPVQDACGYAGAHWAQAEKVDRVEFYEEHVRLFPTCPFAGFARLKIVEKTSGVAGAASASSAASQQVAALPRPLSPPAVPQTTPEAAPQQARSLTEGELTRLVQAELKRVGCDPGRADGTWNASTRSALTRFNTFAKTSLETKVAAAETLEALRSREERVCPLACATGTRASGDECLPIVCGPGQQLSSRGACVAAPKAAPAAASAAKAAPAPARSPARPATGMYDTPQAGMSCTLFGAPLVVGAASAPARPTYWCK